MLSNQFAQLANINKLFSFQNSYTGNPSDLENYNNIKTPEEKANPKYPAPFEVFSPTYFYQSLYKSVPNVESILRNNQIHNFGPITESDSTLARKNWLQYQDDPYNSYMYGLLEATEEDTVNLERRNALLDHLLARHGESPLVIDTLIYGTIYSGDVLKDRVIIKSLYLQNLAILSYNRTKAYNTIGAKKLEAKLLKITPELIDKLLEKTNSKPLTSLEIAFKNVLTYSYENNGIFDTPRIDSEQKITQQDCLDYATITLKLALLLTLKPCYINFIQSPKDFNYFYNKGFYLSSRYLEAVLHQEKSIALWMMTQRKGVISIETNLLLKSARFEMFVRTQEYIYDLQELPYIAFIKLTTVLNTGDTIGVKTFLQQNHALWTIKRIDPATEPTDGYVFVKDTVYGWKATASWNGKYTTSVDHPVFQNTLLYIFPDFIPDFKTSEWKQRLSYFLESQVPLHVQIQPVYANAKRLETLIPLYTTWYNAMLYKATKEGETEAAAEKRYENLRTESSGDLVVKLKKLYKKAADV
jgi:hypothetical protein